MRQVFQNKQIATSKDTIKDHMYKETSVYISAGTLKTDNLP